MTVTLPALPGTNTTTRMDETMNECCVEWNEYVMDGFIPMFEGSGWAVSGDIKVWSPYCHNGTCENYDGAPLY